MIVLAPSASANTRDYKTYDAYLNDLGVVFYEGQQATTVSGALNAQRSDTGNNPHEIRPDFGHHFAQGDFRNGQGQVKFHLGEGRSDPLKYLYGEGIDVSEEGEVSLLKQVLANNDSDFVSPDQMVIADGEIWVVNDSDDTLTHSSSPTSVFEVESHGGTGNIRCIASAGTNLYVNFNTDTRERDGAGTWGTYDNVSYNVIAWVKDRLIGGANTSGQLEEVVDGGANTVIDTLAAGWTFNDIFELGGFIYVCVMNPDSFESEIRCYGDNSDATAIELKHTTRLPQGHIAMKGLGYLGQAFVGGYVESITAWQTPVIYQSISQDAEGRLTLAKLAEAKNNSSVHLQCKAIVAFGESVVFGWSEDGDFGARTGLMRYDLARGALSHFYSYTGGTAPKNVEAIVVKAGRVIWLTKDDELLYNDNDDYRETGTLITSVADFNSPGGLKVWDRIDIDFDPMPTGASIAVYYTTKNPTEDDWVLAGTASTAGSETASFTLHDPIVESSKLALKFVLTRATDTTQTPVLRGYSVRANPKTSDEEWELTRYLWVAPKFKARRGSQEKQQNVRTTLNTLRDSLRDWVTFYEPDATWTMFVESVSEVELAQARHQVTQGSPSKEGFIVALKMRGTRG